MSGHLVVVKSASHFSELVNDDSGAVLCCMFSTEWCGPCQKIYPEIRRLAMAFRGEMVLATIDADDHGELVHSCRVRAFPTFMWVYKGKQLGFHVGADVETVKLKSRDFIQVVRNE